LSRVLIRVRLSLKAGSVCDLLRPQIPHVRLQSHLSQTKCIKTVFPHIWGLFSVN
jgi:hypothetical protein